MNDNMNDNIALITGANSGLGKATAAALAKRGFHVVMVSRSRERGEAARQEIAAASGGTVDLLIADLASQADIRALAGQVTSEYARLPLLINNAGTSILERRLSPDGIEMSLAVNHLASFLLTHLLLDHLIASAPARIVNVGTRLDTTMKFDDLQWEKRPYNGLAAYSESKLGVLHFTFELARRLAGTGVTVNAVHPGVFQSNLGKTDNNNAEPLWLRVITGIGRPFLASAESAAERILYVATAPEIDGVTGRYYGRQVELPAPAQTLDPAANRQLWEISARLTNVT
jgi:NAD(P)-dependent dehydrogenase (short-subunit alcohol dehydrogenase family)